MEFVPDVFEFDHIFCLLTLCNFVKRRLSMYPNVNDRNIEEREREREWFWFAINSNQLAGCYCEGRG